MPPRCERNGNSGICYTCLDPHGIVVQEELEKVQNCAARFGAGNYNFETGSMTWTVRVGVSSQETQKK